MPNHMVSNCILPINEKDFFQPIRVTHYTKGKVFASQSKLDLKYVIVFNHFFNAIVVYESGWRIK